MDEQQNRRAHRHDARIEIDEPLDPRDAPTPRLRPSAITGMLDVLDGPGLNRINRQLWQRVRDLELQLCESPLQSMVRKASLLRNLRCSLDYYNETIEPWLPGVITDLGQSRVRREFSELARHIWTVMEP